MSHSPSLISQRSFALRDKPSVNFDTLAPHYYWLECVLAGRILQKCRTAFLHEARAARSVLILGEGNGRFLCEFLKINSGAQVVCVDASATMLELAKQRISREGLKGERVRFVQGDVLAESPWHSPPVSFDLVVTHFFLDCFRPEQLRSLVARIAERTSAGAAWLLADFRLPATGFRRARAQIILWLAYTFFRIATRLPAYRLTSPDPYLIANGFKLAERQPYDAGLLYSDLWRR